MSEVFKRFFRKKEPAPKSLDEAFTAEALSKEGISLQKAYEIVERMHKLLLVTDIGVLRGRHSLETQELGAKLYLLAIAGKIRIAELSEQIINKYLGMRNHLIMQQFLIDGRLLLQIERNYLEGLLTKSDMQALESISRRVVDIQNSLGMTYSDLYGFREFLDRLYRLRVNILGKD